ncbi:short chain oxidoreductase [Minicystis rosea]|nr:short chain oxidoreductase [Minicystis rosea]
MRRILVTGANKGIGLAIVEAILAQHADTFVLLGARDAERGREAAARLASAHAGWDERIEVLPLDVASDASVERAAERASGARLHGIVNNAGIGADGHDLRAVLETNTFGVRRVSEAFLPLLEPKGGRVVNVTSASGPLFVAQCSPARQRFFLDEKLTWPELRAFLDTCLALGGDPDAFAAEGLGSGAAYGLSKACANAYTGIFARAHRDLCVNACTPGYIATDMTRPHAVAEGTSPEALGMKPPAEGAKAPMHLLFGALEGSGRYYGSDAKRSPLDRYRAPGSPEYTGA